MTSFINWLNGPSRDAKDSKVLMVGLLCSLFVFSIVTAYEEVSASPTFHVDLAQEK